MDGFKNNLLILAKRVNSLKEDINTEEATKMSLIVPFFKELGYDVYNPREFLPEFTADVGIKKGEKVDYAIMLDGEPIILIEAKAVSEKLDNHDSQLFRYFGTTSAKFAILTNGEEYRFYSDLDELNKMDSKPFFTFSFGNLKEIQIAEIAKFCKASFNLNDILDTASELKYTGEITNYLLKEFDSPSETFVKMILAEVYDGRLTQIVLEKFDSVIKKSLKVFVNELVSDKLKAAIANTATDTQMEAVDDNTSKPEVVEPSETVESISQEELEGYLFIKLIVSELINPETIHYRDNQSYLNILLDDSIRKWLCRIYLKKSKKYIQFNDEGGERVEIEYITDIARHKDRLFEVVQKFL